MRQLACILIALVVIGVYGDEPDRLVNGTPTSIEKNPHCVSLRRNNNHFCGGSIISSRYILTAGHCVSSLITDKDLRESVTVVAGTTYLNSGGQSYKLTTPIKFDQRQQPIKLPTRDVTENEDVRIAAWGSTGFYKPIHKDLQKLEAKTILPDTCQYYLRNFMLVYKTELCTLITYGTGLCNGDNGSALIRNTDNTIIGLVSGGRPCAEGYPDVYTNVYHYVSWIKEKMSL